MPSDLRIPEVELQRMKARSKNPKHLACQLLKMFSELFDSYEKHQYNWFGDGSKGKKLLDAERRYIAQNYVELYHPEVKKKPSSERDSFVGHINEFLFKEEANAQR